MILLNVINKLKKKICFKYFALINLHSLFSKKRLRAFCFMLSVFLVAFLCKGYCADFYQ